VAVIAVAVAAIAAVVLITGGVVADSDTPDTLAFFGVIVHTTSAQIFLTGAICMSALLAAAWLLSVGIRRSRDRGAQLAVLRGRAPRPGAGTGPAGPSDCADSQEPAGQHGAAGGSQGVADWSGTGSRGDRTEGRQDSAEERLPRE
jgi:hypothetical protein